MSLKLFMLILGVVTGILGFIVTFGFRNRLGLILVNVASIICLISAITPYKGGRL